MVPGILNAATHYISTTGTDRSDCSGGTVESPWRTWAGPRSNGCISAGDTVYFKSGTYTVSGSTFENGIWKIFGTSGKKITVAVDPAASGAWPVRITGNVKIFGENAVIDGFEFDGDYNAIRNYASQITFQNNYIHTSSSDCVRNSAVHYPGGELNTEISFIGNTITSCGEDAIDNTGARDVIIRGNDISNFITMQIKGGTENILIEGNSIHGSGSLFSGNNMGCTSSYCGSPALLELPVPDRFVAKNVIIRNNLFYNLSSSASTGIKMNGWKDSYVYNNTFYKLGNSWAILLQGNTAGLNYFDSIAANYCKNNPGECSSCGSGCYTLKHDPDNIQIKNNIFLYHDQMASLDSASTNISFSNNIYWNGGSAISFNERGTTRYGLSNFTLESNSYQQDPELNDPNNQDFTPHAGSIAIDNGTPINITSGFGDSNADSSPDIGAIQHAHKSPPSAVTLNVL
jgi:hypothetical protein